MPRHRSMSPQPVLLGLLVSQPRHGYELYQELTCELGQVWHIGLSQLYAQLKQMEEAGWVSVEVEPQPNRPARKVYHLTSEGRTHFSDWVHRPTPYLRFLRIEFLARLYFFQRLRLPGLDQLVAEQKAVCLARADTFARLSAKADSDFRRLVLEFREGQMEAAIRWLDRCLELLGPD